MKTAQRKTTPSQAKAAERYIQSMRKFAEGAGLRDFRAWTDSQNPNGTLTVTVEVGGRRPGQCWDYDVAVITRRGRIRSDWQFQSWGRKN